MTRSGAALGTGFIPTSVKVRNMVQQGASGNPIYGLFVSPGVRVVNSSSFPVTIEEVGYEMHEGDLYPLSRIENIEQWTGTFSRLPQHIESHASMSLALWNREEDKVRGRRIRRAYAKTTCGTLIRVGAGNCGDSLTC